MLKLINKHAEKLKFLAVGLANTAIDFSILFILASLLQWPTLISNMISTSVALSFSFIMNKRFTFGDKTSNRWQPVGFIVVTLIGLWFIQPVIITFGQIIGAQFNINDRVLLLISKLVATVASMIWNYITYKRFVFVGSKQKGQVEG